MQFRSKVGRVGFVKEGKPLILPVNYVSDGVTILFCTAEGTDLSSLGDGSQVAFEIDASRPLYRSGWSVLVRGVAREVTEEDELERLSHSPLQTWGHSDAGRWIRVSIDSISGRRIPEE